MYFINFLDSSQAKEEQLQVQDEDVTPASRDVADAAESKDLLRCVKVVVEPVAETASKVATIAPVPDRTVTKHSVAIRAICCTDFYSCRDSPSPYWRCAIGCAVVTELAVGVVPPTVDRAVRLQRQTGRTAGRNLGHSANVRDLPWNKVIVAVC